jgi:hypothetical protein
MKNRRDYTTPVRYDIVCAPNVKVCTIRLDDNRFNLVHRNIPTDRWGIDLTMEGILPLATDTVWSQFCYYFCYISE